MFAREESEKSEEVADGEGVVYVTLAGNTQRLVQVIKELNDTLVVNDFSSIDKVNTVVGIEVLQGLNHLAACGYDAHLDALDAVVAFDVCVAEALVSGGADGHIVRQVECDGSVVAGGWILTAIGILAGIERAVICNFQC